MTGPGVAPSPRPHDGHKRDFGRVGIVGGCDTRRHVMLGAPVLAGRAALRAGCGGVTLLMPESLVAAALSLLPEAVGVAIPACDGDVDVTAAVQAIDAMDVDTVVVGPGLGLSTGVSAVVKHVLGVSGPPAVIDADALNAIAAMCDDPWPASRSVVLTPHPGEYARLAARYDLVAVGQDEGSRRVAAVALAERTDSVVALKGFGTVVASPHGDSWMCPAGGNTLAVPGSGDVLSGLLAALIAARRRQDATDDMAAARLAVHVHGLAGDRYAATVAGRGMLARELADQLPSVLDEEAST